MGKLDLRPGQLDISGYPATKHTATMTGPSGGITGTTWSATIDGDAVDSITVDGDDLIMVFTFPATVGGYDLVIKQTNVTPDAVAAVGRVTSTLHPSSSQTSTTVPFTLNGATATFTIVGGGGVTDHGALDGLGDDDHTQYAKKASDLSDLASPSTARTNLGLGNVDNTADANKPVSTATQTALDAKAAVYTWDGDSYEVTGGRVFIGPNDPSSEGFTLTDGDQWEDTDA